jgi:hypothetical protein
MLERAPYFNYIIMFDLENLNLSIKLEEPSILKAQNYFNSLSEEQILLLLKQKKIVINGKRTQISKNIRKMILNSYYNQ